MKMRRLYPTICGALALLAFAAAALAQAPEPKAGTGQIGLAPKGELRGLDTPVTITVRDYDLPTAVRMLAEQSGINVALGKDVVGTVTCNLQNVSARVALDSLLRSNGYEIIARDNVLIVVKAGQAQPPVAVEVTHKTKREVYRLPYTGVEQDSVVTGSLAKSAAGGAGQASKAVADTIREMLSPQGRMAYYERQHMVMVEDDEAVVAAIAQFVQEIWATPKQVFIDSKLLEVTLQEGEDLGLRWSTVSKVSSAGKRNQKTGAIEANGTTIETAGPTLGLDRFFSFGVVNANMEVVLEALSSRKRVDLRSNPRVLVMNHRTAMIVVGQEVPYLSSIESTSGTDPIRTYAFKEVAVRLEVTPHIGADNKIFMDVHPTVKSIIGYTDEPKQPILSTREAATNVSVADGSTLIIGGLVQRNITKNRSEVPFLARIPLIGLLFRQKSDTDTKNDLLFLLCPRVVSPDDMDKMLVENKAVTADPPPHAGETQWK